MDRYEMISKIGTRENEINESRLWGKPGGMTNVLDQGLVTALVTCFVYLQSPLLPGNAVYCEIT